MPSLTKKIVAIITALTVSVWLAGPGVVQGATVEELQAQIDLLLAQLADLQAQLAEIQAPAPSVEGCTITSFDRHLVQGMTGDDVKCLQIVLNSDPETQLADSGVGSPGSETNYFGPLTKAAVIKFQEKYASEVLASWGLTKGTGYVGDTTTAKLNELLAAPAEEEEEEEEEEVLPVGENKVELAADTPAAATVAKGAQDVIFLKVNFCAASEANTVSKIVFKRGGIAQDADISNVKLYEGTTQVGSTQAINSTTHKATFSALNWTIPANECKVLTLKANIATGATAGDGVKFEITSASDITSTVALDGVFPISSNAMTVAGIASGWLLLATTTPSGGTIIAGGTEQPVAGFTLTASSTEAVSVHSIKVTEIGSSVDEDLSNLKLWYGSTQLGSTIPELTAGAATFDLSASPLEILAGGSKSVKITVDVGSSTGIKNRTIAFEVTDNTRVTAYGANSGGKLVVYGSSFGSDTWPQNTAAVSIVLGTLTIAKDESYSPSAKEYSRGTDQNDIIAFKFSTGANEGVRITQIKLQETVTALADADVSNITLYDAETGEQLKDTAGNLVPGAGMVSGFVTFGSYTTGLDATGLFDIPKSSNKIILVKADVTTGAATGTSRLGFKITNPTTYIKADGLSSKNDLGTAEISPSSAVPSTAVNHDIIGQGSLTVQKNSGSPVAATYAVGTNDLTLAKFDFITTGEDVTISQLNIYFATDSDGVATTGAADAADLNNVRLYDGDTLLKTDSTLSSGSAEFGLTLSIPKNTTKTITVKGDVPVGSDAAYLTAHINTPADITAVGDSSGQTITASAASWSVAGNLMTKGVPSLTVIGSETPVAQTYIKNASGVTMATFYLTASAAEDIKVTKIRISGNATDSATVATPNDLFSEADVDATYNLTGNIKLFDGDTQLGLTKPSMTDGANSDYADFTGLSLIIPKGETKAIDVQTDVLNSTSSVYIYFGIATASDVTASGVQSGTSATVVATGGVAGKGMTFSSSGTLTVSQDVNTPISAQVIEGTTGDNAATFGSWKFVATNEDISITRLTFDVVHSTAATGSSVGGSSPATSILATNTPVYFDYSLNDNATQTCTIATATDMTSGALIAAEIEADCPDLKVSYANSVYNVWASTTAGGYSVELTDYAASAASSTADNLKLGLKYGGTETIGAQAGADANVIKVSLYDGATKLADAYIGASRANRVEFGCNDCTPLVEVSKTASKILSLKADLSNYIAATEGSTLAFRLGTSTAASDTDYVYGKGVSSGTALATTTILNSAGGTGAIGALESNAMYLYATKPTVSLNAASPSGKQSPSSNGEVFRFDVTVPAAGFDVTVNAIRFSISTNEATSTWDKVYKLYKSTDLSTIIGSGVSYANTTSTDTTGWVAIYPTSGNQIGSGSTGTYVLKADTSTMDTNAATDQLLTISIEDGDFYWDDSLIGNARDKTLNLPVLGNTLKF